MTDPLMPIPLDEIDPVAVIRDRTGYDAEPFDELKLSLATSGLRQPIEVYPLPEPRDGRRYGLISGARRLAAFRALRDDGRPGCDTIPAFVRPTRSIAETLAAMVEENSIRAEVSPWEQALVAVRARDSQAFATIEAAVDQLYSTCNRDRRRRIRAVAHLIEDLDGYLDAPEKLSQQQLLRLAAAAARGYAPIMQHALAETRSREPGTQWRILKGILLESEDPEIPAPSHAAASRGRPRRLYRTPRPRSIAVRRERIPDGWCLHFTGRDATGELIDRIFDELEAIFVPQ